MFLPREGIVWFLSVFALQSAAYSRSKCWKTWGIRPVLLGRHLQLSCPQHYGGIEFPVSRDGFAVTLRDTTGHWCLWGLWAIYHNPLDVTTQPVPHSPHCASIRSLALQMSDKYDGQGWCVQGITEVQNGGICSSSLVHWGSHSIVEGLWVGQAAQTHCGLLEVSFGLSAHLRGWACLRRSASLSTDCVLWESQEKADHYIAHEEQRVKWSLHLWHETKGLC